MKIPFLVIISAALCFSVSAQKKVTSNCEAVLQVDPKTEIQEKVHYIFTGSDTTGLNVKMSKITVVEGRQELVKKRKSKDCISPKPEDCLVEVWEDIPAVTMNLYTLSSPDLTDQYDKRIEKVRVTLQEGGVKNAAIICPKNRSPRLVSQIQEALIKLGYPLTSNGIYDQATQLSVTDFQRSKFLAYGDLTLETVAALGIK